MALGRTIRASAFFAGMAFAIVQVFPHFLGANVMASKRKIKPTGDANPDPISGEPGAHPVGTGVGAAITGAAAGVAGGALAGPIGAAAGAVVGAIAGGLAGKAVEETFDPTAEDAYWKANFHQRPYVDKGGDYETYRPAYQYGWEARRRHADRRFEDVEPELATGWPNAKTKSKLDWDKARQAARDAWDRVERQLPGDVDGSGK
jgi:hypothetical protein